MIVSHKHEFIFLKTRKTAGTSLEIALSEFCGPEDIITPITEEDEEQRRALGFRGPQNLEAAGGHHGDADQTGTEPLYFYNHAPASFVHCHVGDDVWSRYFKFSIERNPFDKAISRYYWNTAENARPPIEEYLESAEVELLSNWSIYTIDNEVAVDFMARYENLADDLATAMQRIGVTQELHLPHAKGGYRRDRRHYSQVLSARSRSLIERICAKEIAQFSYRWTGA